MPDSKPDLADDRNPTPAHVWLESYHSECRQHHADLNRRETLWSWARLVTFFAAIGVWFAIAEQPAFAGAISGAMLLTFYVAVRRHRLARERCAFARRLLDVIAESQSRCGGSVGLVRSRERPVDPTDPDAALEALLDPGRTWPLTDQERDDLDLYSEPVGIFGLLNRTSTSIGRRRLRDMVDHPCLSSERILARQATVRWLDEHAAERFRLMAATAALRGQGRALDRLAATIRRARPLPPFVVAPAMRLWATLSGLFTLLALGQTLIGAYGWGWALLVLLALNAMRFARMRRTVQEALKPWRDAHDTARGHLALARQGDVDLPSATDLAALRGRFTAVSQREVLPSLCKLLPWTDTGGMIHTLLNIVIFYDVLLADAILRRVLPSQNELLASLAASAELDALLSLACFAWEQPHVCYPTPVAEPTVLISAGRHPLVPPDRVVPNDVSLRGAERVWVITGSNMAGKSTLLRMTAVNVLLAQIGTTAVAETMTWSPARLITDLGVRDNLAADESYFLAEVRHLRRMVSPADDAAPVLGLVDEPFRGTNSQEQVAASLAVLQHLIESPHLFVVATHERRLTDLADGQAATNHHFREDLDGDGLVFDYTLRPGPARTRTALRVLEREAYPPEVIRRAHEWVEQTPDQPPVESEAGNRTNGARQHGPDAGPSAS